MPRRRQKKQDPVKGKAIRFARGTYEGLEGWLDKANKTSKESGQVWVIVNDTQYEEEVHTRVLKTSIRKPRSKPSTWAEAAIQQHPRLNKKINELAYLLASFKVSGANETSVLQHIAAEVDHYRTAGGVKKVNSVDWSGPNIIEM